jgi:16S rRNA processing protein RimM
VTAEPAESFDGLTLARIVRPWGRRGEVAAEIMTDFPERLARLRKVYLFDGRKPAYSIGLRSYRLHIGQAILHFEGVDSINDAELLRGVQVQVPASERTRLNPGRFYIDELIGCEVWETAGDGAGLLGTVREVQRAAEAGKDATPESWLLAVDTPDGEVLVPFAAEICRRVDLTARLIEVLLPEGLRELNS